MIVIVYEMKMGNTVIKEACIPDLNLFVNDESSFCFKRKEEVEFRLSHGINKKEINNREFDGMFSSLRNMLANVSDLEKEIKFVLEL